MTELQSVPGSPNNKDVAVFNIYGAVKDMKKTFGDLDGYVCFTNTGQDDI